MKKFLSTICAAALAATLNIPGTAMAGTVPAPRVAPDMERLVQTVQYGEYRGGRRADRGWHRGNRWDRGSHWRGHRGHRNYRPGYRRHGGYWFPPAAFAAGAILGGAIAAQPPRTRVRGYDNAHVQWCYDRYRSYRASDNTFQPYNGPRRPCRSPYY